MSKCKECGQTTNDVEESVFHVISKHTERALIALINANDALRTQLLQAFFDL